MPLHFAPAVLLASAYTINLDGITSGANANSDAVALANGVNFASAYLANTFDENFNVIGQHWAPYSLADLTNCWMVVSIK